MLMSSSLFMDQKEYAELKRKFIALYPNIPERIRYEDILAVIEGEPFTWASAYFEVKNNTNTGKKIIEMLKELEILWNQKYPKT